MIQNFKVIWNTNLTHDVHEITFECERNLEMIEWQFITLLLDKIWGRAYSILKIEWNKMMLIVKKWKIEDWGRWWSKMICELAIWDVLKWVWPAGHFLLKQTDNNKMFIWTWTWFPPLYNQIIWVLKNPLTPLSGKNLPKLKLLFWARTLKDLFYIEELEKLKKENSNFDFEIYLSREQADSYNSGYVTDFLKEKNIDSFEEFYICW
jgi:Na+-transporting NADH:ubiquinone oxidoreductase subunit NqrF